MLKDNIGYESVKMMKLSYHETKYMVLQNWQFLEEVHFKPVTST